MANRLCTILITGAGSGLGRGLAIFFANQGHSVIVTDRTLEKCQQTVAALENFASRDLAHALDVTSNESVATLMRDLGDQPVDVLINNAGVQHVAKLEEFPIQRWAEMTDIMVNGPVRLTQAVLPGMRRRGFGRIINIGSIHSLVASPGKTAYTAAKHALLGFSKSLALETGDVDITINTICPSFIRTPLVDNQIAQLAKLHNLPEADIIQKMMLGPMPKKAFVTFEEVAGTAEFLMSPAARNITGQSIAIDGGWTAQ